MSAPSSKTFTDDLVVMTSDGAMSSPLVITYDEGTVTVEYTFGGESAVLDSNVGYFSADDLFRDIDRWLSDIPRDCDDRVIPFGQQ